MNIYKRISRDFGFKLEFVGKDFQYGNGHFKNNCAMVNNTIFVGEYDDDIIEIFSIFHEIGHTKCTITYDTVYELEKQCWDIGIKLAKSYGYELEDYVEGYIKKCLDTYKNYELIEKLEWVKPDKIYLNDYGIFRKGNELYFGFLKSDNVSFIGENKDTIIFNVDWFCPMSLFLDKIK